MAKQDISLNFSQGLDTKTDPNQVSPGKFLLLQNSIFDEIGALQKRNGFLEITSLPNPASFLTTFNGALTAIGQTLQAYTPTLNPWVTTGRIQPLSLSTLPLIRNSINQIKSDSVVAPNGLVCTVYIQYDGVTSSYRYAVSDSTTGQAAIQPKVIPVSSGTVTGSPRVFLIGNYFIIVFTNTITGTDHLQYIAISLSNPNVVTANANIASSYTSKNTVSWDGVAVGNNLYITYNTVAGGQALKLTYLTAASASIGGPPISPVAYAGQICTQMSMCADITSPQNPIIYASYYDRVGMTGFIFAVDQNLNPVLAPTQIIASEALFNITCAASNGTCTSFYEVINVYSYDAGVSSHYINSITCSQAGVVGMEKTVIRSVGLASKAFVVNSVVYFLSLYQSNFQPTYFLINGSTSTQTSPVIVAKLAYGNGGNSNSNFQYIEFGLPFVTVSGSTAMVSYLLKDLIEAAPKQNTGISSTAQNPLQTSNVYTQSGISLASITFGTDGLDTAEIGSNLNISGGFLVGYDGYQSTEQNFFVYPDNIECAWSATGGAIHAQPDGSTNTKAYWYQVTYEWTDNQGNVQRSAPSIPVAVTTTSNGTSGSITVNVPYLRLTYKTNVKIVIYRWSVAQQVYYQVTSVSTPTLNSTTSDSLAYVDTLADASILGGNIIYTTGGVVENVNAPASNILTLFDDRLWLVDAEDENLLWYSKQVIESTPVEMSDLFTFYVAPTTGAQGSTGIISALSVMDDKLIIFKKDAIYYINGNGPDNTGSNSGYNGPIFITSTVGCALQNSIVFTPSGLMFQSDKGIWLLGRDLNVSYVGAAVEAYTKEGTVLSALGIPETNQVRFTMSQGVTLLYDYYVGQWGTFVGIPGISSTLYQGLHTFIDQYGRVFQENPGSYLDGSSPVLMGFKTGWLGVGGLRGYERIHEFSFLGNYFSPHKALVQVAYDYGFPSHQSIYTPTNYTPPYGGAPIYGDGPYGGSAIEQFRVFAKKQKCKAFQISFQEVFDPSFGTVAGQGISLSGINMVVTLKKRWAPVSGRNSVG